ncbi:VRR-NUC domain-containing protein [Sulfitobacter noctilucae]|uniref:VRR-NUC domain-containing protein n=1 Tax=Sulfitobacter noctilucae TaxID=1342302 RepID=UPI0013778745|nr:VRR-NUC domain-containing protein [Sulfitobacter noctilucae]
MGNDSRFKPEVSYNMRTNPPTPLMERSIFGNDTTDAIDWTRGGIEHIKNRIGQDGTPYQTGDARRPDVIIVRDPESPPVQTNITRVVEFKFPGDSFSDEQRANYQRIGGMPPLELNVEECDCADDDETRGQVALVTAAQDVTENDRSLLSRIGWGALGTVAAIGTAIMAIVPLDGPAGEIALGAGTAAAFGRAFAATGWTLARQRAAATVATQRWQTIFGGGF